jgi:hypothetical protein
MDIQAWCGHCGESFRLDELVVGGFTGRCPRCDRQLAPDYTPIASTAIHDLLAAAATLREAAERLGEVAPRLHIDARKLTTEVAEALDHA